MFSHSNPEEFLSDPPENLLLFGHTVVLIMKVGPESDSAGIHEPR
jgi:hypothetical protein